MSKVIVDEDLRARLNGLSDEAEFFDPSGMSLGVFIPADEFRARVYERAREDVSLDELKRISQETGGRPLADILKSLGQS